MPSPGTIQEKHPGFGKPLGGLPPLAGAKESPRVAKPGDRVLGENLLPNQHMPVGVDVRHRTGCDIEGDKCDDRNKQVGRLEIEEQGYPTAVPNDRRLRREGSCLCHD